MLYVFDSNSFIVISHYFPNSFPSFWEKLDEYVNNQKIVSVREVYNELNNNSSKQHLIDWINKNKSIFMIPTVEELLFVSEIFKIKHFQYLISEKQRLKGTPVADPFVIASAKINNGCVVTEETNKEHAARIPNICEHFGIEYTNIEGFLRRENWKF